jgi:hypothetical protein
MMVPSASDFWHTGAALPLVSPQRIADTVVEFWDDGAMRSNVANACKQHFDTVVWEPAIKLFTDKLVSAHEWGVEMAGTPRTTKDSGEESQ